MTTYLDPNNQPRSPRVTAEGALLQGPSPELELNSAAVVAAVSNYDFLSGAVNGWFDTKGYNSVSFSVISVGTISAGTIDFQQTDDPINAPNGVQWQLTDMTVATGARAVGTGTIGSNTVRQFSGPVQSRYVRLKVGTAVSGIGSVRVSAQFSAAPYADLLPAYVQGPVSDNAAGSSYPLVIAGMQATANPAAGNTGRLRQILSTLVGALIVKPYSIPEAEWSYTGTLSTTTAVAAKAAGAAGIKNYVTSLQYQNTNGTATQVTVLDGSTVLATFNAPANMALPATVSFGCPLKGTAATALNVNCGTAGAAVLMNVQGYQAP